MLWIGTRNVFLSLRKQMIQGPTCHAEDTHVHLLCSDKWRTQAGEDSGLACEEWAVWDVILLIFKRCLYDEKIENLSNCMSS